MILKLPKGQRSDDDKDDNVLLICNYIILRNLSVILRQENAQWLNN